MSKEGRFLIYCLEIYGAEKGIGANRAFELLDEHGAVGYIMRNYGALHTTGERYIVEDIDRYIATHQTV